MFKQPGFGVLRLPVAHILLRSRPNSEPTHVLLFGLRTHTYSHSCSSTSTCLAPVFFWVILLFFPIAHVLHVNVHVSASLRAKSARNGKEQQHVRRLGVRSRSKQYVR